VFCYKLPCWLSMHPDTAFPPQVVIARLPFSSSSTLFPGLTSPRPALAVQWTTITALGEDYPWPEHSTKRLQTRTDLQVVNWFQAWPSAINPQSSTKQDTITKGCAPANQVYTHKGHKPCSTIPGQYILQSRHINNPVQKGQATQEHVNWSQLNKSNNCLAQAFLHI
jgi:hypothetical protein